MPDNRPAAVESELADERAFHERVRAAQAEMRRRTGLTRERFETEFLAGGRPAADNELAYLMAKYTTARMKDLADRELALFFGRLWFDRTADNPDEEFHIGRRHIRDERATPLVLDWRAPVAEHYYRASAHDRRGVTLRRRFGFQGAELTGFEDEDLRLGEDVASDLLTAEIERPRTGPMRDIVATIQPEQDELIRRPASTTLCVQGAPGTGKTAVGLHRAAWLLYTYAEQLRRAGVLVIGPNEGFLAYIAGVLPTLGESAVFQVTVDQLMRSETATGADTEAAARVKHDARMSRVCERAVWGHVGRAEDAGVTAEESLLIVDGGWRWRLGANYLNESIDTARRTCRTYGAGRESLEEAIVHGVRRQVEIRAGYSPDGKWATKLKRTPAVKDLLTAVWPKLTAKAVMRKLYLDPAFRADACAGLLDDDEAALLAARGRTVQPTPADLIVADEIAAHLALPEPGDGYGHIVVDEAQDLSPMQCRAIARRCAGGSLTVLGDLAQGTTVWAAADWRTQMVHLGRPESEHTELTVGFRVPGVIIDQANRLLPHLGVDVAPARSLRRDGAFEPVATEDLSDGVAGAVAKALAEPGLIGVIAAEADLPALEAALDRTVTDPGLRERVETVPASLAKGLEFDHVVVAEPAAVVAEPENDRVGLRHLYVALTRAVSRLSVVHTRALPPQMGR